MLTDSARFKLERLYLALIEAKISVEDAVLLLFAEDYLVYLEESGIRATREEVIEQVDQMCRKIDATDLEHYLLKD